MGRAISPPHTAFVPSAPHDQGFLALTRSLRLLVVAVIATATGLAALSAIFFPLDAADTGLDGALLF